MDTKAELCTHNIHCPIVQSWALAVILIFYIRKTDNFCILHLGWSMANR